MLGIGRHGPTGPRRLVDVESEGGATAVPGTAGPDAPRLPVREAMAVLAAIDGIGPVTMERLLATFGGPREVLAAANGRTGVADLRAASRDPDDRWPRMTEAAAQALRAAAGAPETVLESIHAAGVHLLALDDPAYPSRLRLIEMPPRFLFVRGSDAALDGRRAVAVVGTRRPTDDGRRTARRISAALARSGALVVSGLAIGIDGAAHAAVVGEAGITVAVIGGGHARLSPAAHDRLADAIADGGGAVISEHAPGVPPSRGTFPRRNRVISGLADAVVVVEAGARSGALLTAAWALEQGRELFLVPGSIDSPQSAGCLAWLRDYPGVAHVVAGVPQLLEDLGLEAAAAFVEARSARRGGGSMVPPAHPTRVPSVEAVMRDLPEREGRLLQAIVRGAATADELAAVTGLSIGAVLGGLTGLEGLGLAVGAYGRYRLPDDAGHRVRTVDGSAA